MTSPPVAAPPVPAATGTTAESATAPASPADRGGAVIKEMVDRAGIVPGFLKAHHRTENGGAGREFGVLSVPAPTHRDQAAVAAETVRRNTPRFEDPGRLAVDPVSGRHTPEFIRFFSSRDAPIGAANHPAGLDRFHARNLMRAYGVSAAESTAT